MTELLAALGGAVFAGIFALLLRRLDSRERATVRGEDRKERERERQEDIEERDRQRRYDQGVSAAEHFLEAVTRIQWIVHSGELQNVKQELPTQGMEMSSARHMVALYFPPDVVEKADGVSQAISSLLTASTGTEVRPKPNPEVVEHAERKYNLSILEFIEALQQHLGVETDIPPSDEARVRTMIHDIPGE